MMDYEDLVKEHIDRFNKAFDHFIIQFVDTYILQIPFDYNDEANYRKIAEWMKEQGIELCQRTGQWPDLETMQTESGVTVQYQIPRDSGYFGVKFNDRIYKFSDYIKDLET